MIPRKKILILSENEFKSSSLSGPLRVVGHEVHTQKKLADGVGFCQFVQVNDRKIDLLIVDNAQIDGRWLKELQHQFDVEYLLLIGEPSSCSELYCVAGKVACLCCPTALLAAVNELFYPKELLNYQMNVGLKI